MSQKFLFVPIPLTVGAVLSVAACGHIVPDDAIKPGSMGTGGSNPTGTGGSGNAGSGNAGMGVTGECTDAPSQQHAGRTMPGYQTPADAATKAADVLRDMTQQQKIDQMSGIPEGDHDWQDIERSPDVENVNGLAIRGYRYRDAGHGVNLDAGQDNRPKDANNFATNFPQASTRGASWDVELEWRLGEAMGDETAASKNNMLLAPCMNIIRHAFWGRTQETYGEDTYHVGRMASALTAGIQQHVAACAKHFAANNVEKGRANQDALMDEQTLREIYARHFEMVVQDGGVACIMASYNKINTVKSTQNAHLLQNVLKAPVAQGGMGYRGLVISDWWAMPGDMGPVQSTTALANAREAALAGLDIEVPWTLNYGQLGAAIAADGTGAVGRAVEQAAGRVLEQKFRFNTAIGDGDSGDPWSVQGSTNTRLAGASIETFQDHLDLAEEAAYKSAVLLDNGPAGMPVLPLSSVPSIAVVGDDVTFALISTTPPKTGNVFNFGIHVPAGDRGSSRVNADPAQSVGPADGLRIVGANYGVTTVTPFTTAAAATGVGDATVVVVGYTPGDEGEEYAISAGGDRQDYNLPHAQNQLVSDVLSANEQTPGKKTVIIIESGSIVNLPWLDHTNKNQATIWAGYAGMRAGLAYGKLLFGEKNFSGKMPLAWPKGSIPYNFKDEPMATSTSTTMGYFFGYREYDRLAASGQPFPLYFEFGHGLSYTTFAYSNLTVPCEAEGITKQGILDVKVDIENTGQVAGEEVAMLFVKGPPYSGSGWRPIKELKSFAKVALTPGQKETVRLPLRIRDLRRWEGGPDGSWVVDNGEYTLQVAGSSKEADLILNERKFTVHD